MPESYVDTSGWFKKSNNVNAVLLKVVPRVVEYGLDVLHQEVIQNVSGPHYKPGTRGPGTGEMPVPRVTADLAGSVQRSYDKRNPEMGAIFSSNKKAPHNVFVHDGANSQKPRRFIKDAVDSKSKEIRNYFDNEVMSEIRNAGQ